MSALSRTREEVDPRDEAMLADASPLAGDLEDFKDLFVEGQERGFVTQEEIATRLEEADLSEDQVRDMHSHFADLGVEVVAADLADAPSADGKLDRAAAVQGQP